MAAAARFAPGQLRLILKIRFDAGGGEDRYFDSLIFLRELRWMASRVELSLHIFFIL